ncbi:MAG: DUF4271 domain-containing protein [Mariniphaga sp.]|nr:DUF4271 domain-containing protein [Mariniphaga sp.]
MDYRFIYQQDTSKVKLPVEKSSGIPDGGQLNIDRNALLPLGPIPERKKEIKEVDTVKPQPVSVAPFRIQLRNIWWQQENKLLIGDSRYLEPRTEIQLVSPLNNEHVGLQLPAHQINQMNYDWLTFLLLAALAIFASVRTTWNKYVLHLFQSVVNNTTSARLFQEKNTSDIQGAFLLDILFYLVFAVFSFQLLNFFQVDLSFGNSRLFLSSMGLIVAYFLIKKLIYRFFGFLIEKTGETKEYLFNMNNFARVAGIILFPVVTVIAFYPFSNIKIPVFFGLFLVGAIYFLLISRGFVILMNKQFSIFYLFLYFCTLEFLPLVLLFKILVV